MQNWLECGAVELGEALRRREISAVELLELNFDQARRVGPSINPLAVLLEEQACRDAELADQALKAGKPGALCGLPVTVKDSQWLAGVPCANGSLSLRDFVPDQTCEAIARLRAAGAVVFAKTTCPEFCVSGTNSSEIYGSTVNPWNPSRTPGGSSGGAAAALASGVGSLALGSDGGGSIRIPSAFCGLVGFKPSHNVVPRSPGFSTWESLVAYGPMARSVADARLMFDVLAGDSIQLHKMESRDNPDRPILFSETLGFAPVDNDVQRCFRQTMERFSEAGIRIKPDDPGLTSSVVTWATLATHDMWSYKRPVTNGRSDAVDAANQLAYDDFGHYAREFIRFGSQFSDTEVADAQAHVRVVHDAYLNMFRRNRATILVTPTLGCEAFSLDSIHPAQIGDTDITMPWLDWAGFLYDANLAGMPACSIPMGVGDEGLPLGLQIIGLPGNDREVLSVAGQLESIIGWSYGLAPGVLPGNPAKAESMVNSIPPHAAFDTAMPVTPANT